MNEKQPIGIMPERIWLFKRAKELSESIHRYLSAGLANEQTDRRVEELSRHLFTLRKIYETLVICPNAGKSSSCIECFHSIPHAVNGGCHLINQADPVCSTCSPIKDGEEK